MAPSLLPLARGLGSSKPKRVLQGRPNEAERSENLSADYNTQHGATSPLELQRLIWQHMNPNR